MKKNVMTMIGIAIGAVITGVAVGARSKKAQKGVDYVVQKGKDLVNNVRERFAKSENSCDEEVEDAQIVEAETSPIEEAPAE